LLVENSFDRKTGISLISFFGIIIIIIINNNNKPPSLQSLAGSSSAKMNISGRKGWSLMILCLTAVSAFHAEPSPCLKSVSQLHAATSGASGHGIWIEDTIDVDATDVNPPKIKVQRFHETWQWRHRGRTYDINYRVEGPESGSPILLTHGFGANLNHFRYNIPALVKEGYRVYAVDLLGFGASEKPGKPETVGFSVELFSQQIVDFISSRQVQEGQEDGNRSWILAGNSIGGLCSLQVAAREPSTLSFEISSVILFNSAGGMSGFRYSDTPSYLHPLMAHVQYFVLSPRFFHGSLVYSVIAQRTIIEPLLQKAGIYKDLNNVDEELLNILLQPAMDPGAQDVFLSIYGGPAGPTRESLLESIAKRRNRSQGPVPILALWGSDDGFVPLDDTVKSWTTTFSDFFQLEIVENAGHCIHDEHPSLVNDKMIAFLRKQNQS
jgi:pimeloyl-ACP methyl ester carboxylesterase